MNPSNPILEWLLEEADPSVRLRTLTELLDLPDSSPEVGAAQSAVLQSEPVQKILAQMHPDGVWLQKNPRTGAVLGAGVEYGAFATTHYCLAYLAELGIARALPAVEKAAERYLDLQQPDGDWFGHYSCLIGLNLRTFALLGYQDDPRVRRSLELLLETDREDGGFLCDMHAGKYRTRAVKSCIRGSVKALLALAEYPETWDHPRCRRLVSYFLGRGGVYRSTQPGEFVNPDMQRASFPVTWRANLWEVLYALSKMGWGQDERLVQAWEELDRKADPAGAYRLDWTPEQCPWKVGKRGEVNKWLTFFGRMARKMRAQSDRIELDPNGNRIEMTG